MFNNILIYKYTLKFVLKGTIFFLNLTSNLLLPAYLNKIQLYTVIDYYFSVCATGWWLVDAQGELGWAPASFLILSDEENAHDEEQENRALIGHEKGRF